MTHRNGRYNSSQWGLFMYEQDWLDTEYDNVVHLNTNATAGRTWLMQMGTAAARNDMTIQYCMSHCRHIMQSVEIPAVTNARASGDYHPGSDQWHPLATTAIFGWAVGIAGTKDNYWSTNHQAGSSYKDYETIGEPYNRLQAAISTISKGRTSIFTINLLFFPPFYLLFLRGEGKMVHFFFSPGGWGVT